jgi:hypothetical protein
LPLVIAFIGAEIMFNLVHLFFWRDNITDV